VTKVNVPGVVNMQDVDFRETLYTIDKRGNRKWVYPTFAPGRFFKRRATVMYTLLFLLLSMPWIPVGASQAIWLDIPHRRFVVFGETFWATDTRFLFLLLASAGISLFFFTSLLGRVWCGWACPQTVFLEFVFRPIERLIEGGPAARMRLDASPWSVRKLCVKGTKFLVFLIVSWVIASTLLAYFVGREPLLAMMADSPSEHLGLFIMTLLLMGVFLFEFGWFREQFCTVLCPYARFQSVLMDRDSLLVGYDVMRGEPRAKSSAERGDCVDCGLCVRVCPTGIDIRNGTQLECIQCASCIDACDSVMTKLKRPTGLIRYDTERGLQERVRRFLRPRVIAYAAILTLLVSLFVGSLVVRKDGDFLVIRQSKADLFQQLPNGDVVNQFKVHIGNKSPEPRSYRVSLVRQDPVQLVTPVTPFPVTAGQSAMMPLFVQFSPLAFHGASVLVQVEDEKGVLGRQEVPIVRPGR
jgi:cytochrome c oxidase accessory protein FixG